MARIRLVLLTLVVAWTTRTSTAQVSAPEAHFGFRMGAEHHLAAAPDIESYFDLVAARSDRVKIVEIGTSTEGHRTVAAIISAPENIRNLEQIREVNQRLSDPRALAPEEANRLASAHRVVLAIGAGIHATEAGATQAACELLHALATSTDAEILRVLDNVVIVLLPLMNPDGHRVVAAWDQTTRNTPFEGAPLPWLYHKYAGHEINRDAFMLNLAESRNLARFFYASWHPQVFLSLHQMESGGPRMFVPPVADPINPNYDPLIWREAAVLGGAMALELQRDGRSGVESNARFDYYWPGYEDSAPLGHNTVCLLAEVANPAGSSRTTPVSTERAPQTPAVEEPTVNYPDPWRGGTWTLRDVIDYDLSAVYGLVRAAASYRPLIVQNFVEMGRRAVAAGERGGPFAFIIPPEQYDPHAVSRLEDLLLQGGIEIHRALEPFRADGEPYPAGSDIILLAQPYRAYVKTLLERQDYPTRRVPGEAIRPYDVAGWTLPAQMGVDVRTIDRTFEPPAMSRVAAAAIPAAKVWSATKPNFYVIDARGTGGALAVNRLVGAGVEPSWLAGGLELNGYRYAAGSLVVPASTAARPVVERIAAELGLRADGIRGSGALTASSRRLEGVRDPLQPVGTARLAVYRPWLPNADEGWTRWLLDRFEFRYASINDAEIRAGSLRQRFDAIILPSATPDQLKAGNAPGLLPPEYVGGLGESGIAQLRAFVQAGGTLISLDESGELLIAEFGLPIRDVVRDAAPSEFSCPGSILRIDLDPLQPLAFGMNPHTAGFFRSGAAYAIVQPPSGETRPGTANQPVAVVAKYGAENLLLSGWLEGEQVIAGRPAVVDIGLGLGHVVLLGFSTGHRGQSHATFRLLFNSIFTAPQHPLIQPGRK